MIIEKFRGIFSAFYNPLELSSHYMTVTSLATVHLNENGSDSLFLELRIGLKHWSQPGLVSSDRAVKSVWRERRKEWRNERGTDNEICTPRAL